MSALQIADTAARGVHVVACVGLFGAFTALLLAGPTDRPTGLAWQRRTTAGARALAIVALVSGGAAVALQTAVLEQRLGAALEAPAIVKMLLDTHGGIVWCARLGLLGVVAAFMFMRADLARRADWRAAHGEGALLAAGGLALLAAAGHASAVAPDARLAIAADMAHLLAAGAWGGALLPLVLLLRAGARDDGADARPYAVLAVRRFSRWALLIVGAIVITGAISAWIEDGSIAALVGTLHGRLLVAKVAIFLTIMLPAALNRRAIGGLSGPAETEGRPAMRRLARAAGYEVAGVVLVLAITALLTVEPPGRHERPAWPLPFRFTASALTQNPAARPRAFLGSQVAVLGAAGILAAVVLRQRRRLLLAAGAAVVAAGGALALPSLAVQAYPTTFRRPDVPYDAPSIVAGADAYAEHCASCHGPDGRGTGAAVSLIPAPADRRESHVDVPTAGDLFWWIGHGIGRMPALGSRLDEEMRWNVVNFIRALSAADTARALSPRIEPDRARVVAPDFPFAVGPAPARVLRDYRGRRDVLIVLYTLPGSRPRLEQLADAYESLVTAGVEVIAVPTDAAPDAIKHLGVRTFVLFPVVTDGGDDIVRAYRLFAPAPHAELLVDRAGYLRAISRGPGDVATVLANVQRLDRETPAAPPDEHVH